MFRNLKKTMIIAEIGVNHNGNLSLALKLILKAKEAGADFVKFQSFQTDFLAKKNTPKVDYQLKNMISKDTHFAMLKKLELDFETQLKLFNFCKKVKIGFLSTP
jgi:N,N'-diacetyllegionaminate synthase